MSRDLVAFESAAGRWIIAVCVLGSGVAFLEATVVNVALPAIGEDLGASTAGLQWILNGYLLTLAALILLGGSLGDRLGSNSMRSGGESGPDGSGTSTAFEPGWTTARFARIMSPYTRSWSAPALASRRACSLLRRCSRDWSAALRDCRIWLRSCCVARRADSLALTAASAALIEGPALLVASGRWRSSKGYTTGAAPERTCVTPRPPAA